MAESVPWTLTCLRLSASTLTFFCTSTTARSVSRRPSCAGPPPRGASAPSANPHRFNRVEVSGLVTAARELAAGFLGVDASRAAWVRNVSEGVSAVLGSLRLGPGDELVTSTHGYGAVRKALGHHAAPRRGAGRRGGLPARRRGRRDRGGLRRRVLAPHPAGRGRPDHPRRPPR